MALEEETGFLIEQDEADLILSEIRCSPKYKKYNYGNPPKNKYETSWLSVRTPFGKKLHEARNGGRIFFRKIFWQKLIFSNFNIHCFGHSCYPKKDWESSTSMTRRVKMNFTKRPKRLKLIPFDME